MTGLFKTPTRIPMLFLLNTERHCQSDRQTDRPTNRRTRMEKSWHSETQITTVAPSVATTEIQTSIYTPPNNPSLQQVFVYDWVFFYAKLPWVQNQLEQPTNQTIIGFQKVLGKHLFNHRDRGCSGISSNHHHPSILPPWCQVLLLKCKKTILAQTATVAQHHWNQPKKTFNDFNMKNYDKTTKIAVLGAGEIGFHIAMLKWG